MALGRQDEEPEGGDQADDGDHQRGLCGRWTSLSRPHRVRRVAVALPVWLLAESTAACCSVWVWPHAAVVGGRSAGGRRGGRRRRCGGRPARGDARRARRAGCSFVGTASNATVIWKLAALRRAGAATAGARAARRRRPACSDRVELCIPTRVTPSMSRSAASRRATPSWPSAQPAMLERRTADRRSELAGGARRRGVTGGRSAQALEGHVRRDHEGKLLEDAIPVEAALGEARHRRCRGSR